MSCKMKIKILIVAIFIKVLFSKKPYRRQDQAIWKIECELGFLVDSECPIDGGWSQWSSWSNCRGLCDDIGHKQRIRECTNPPPSNDGLYCSGSNDQTDICYLTNCTLEDFRRLVAGDTLRSKALRQLESVPALLEKCLQIQCRFESIESALATDNTWKLDPEALWNSLQCVRYNIGCPLVGAWGSWGSWSACSARCGRGFKWKLRKCDAPAPSASYLTCDGMPFYAEQCNGEHCAVNGLETETRGANWGLWGEWSKCSVECGAGVRRRRRACLEKRIPRSSDIWETHCRGQHDQLEVCSSNKCIFNGGWTEWGPWGPCSQSCGIGKRSRVRSCTRPVPSRNGESCSGPRTEVYSCYLTPCEAYTHVVAVLNGEGYLHYNNLNKRSTLLHVYIRFKTLSQYGTLLRRGTINGPHIRITLQRLHICVDSSGETLSCGLSRLCTLNAILPEKWHSIMVSVTTKAVYLSIDNFQPKLKEKFPCEPNLPNEVLSFRIGEKFYGEIQEVIINFTPLKLKAEKNSTNTNELNPFFTTNIAYEKATIEEAFLELSNGQYLRMACFDNQEEWNLELKLKSLKESGSLLLLGDENTNNWLFITIRNRRIKFSLMLNDVKSESVSSKDYPIEQWLDIYVSKKKDSDILQATLNGQEKLHVILAEEQLRRRRINERNIYNNLYKTSNNNITTRFLHEAVPFALCSDDLFIGGNPKFYDKYYTPPFNGIIASVAINNILQDLIKSDVETNVHDTVQVSSRAASISNSYHETFWGKSKLLNLSCVHTRSLRATHRSQWLKLDVGIRNSYTGKKVRSIDNGRVLRLQANADDDLIIFYTCRSYGNRLARNIITYGIMGNALNSHGPNTITAISLCTTVILLIITLGWLLIECIKDLRDGYGFFRDQHLSPELEAEAICEFIDNNAHLIKSKNAIEMSKCRARQTAKMAMRKISKCSSRHETNCKQFEKPSEKSSIGSDCGTLPAGSENHDAPTPAHQVYRCEQSFVSSPRHGSRSSPDAKLSSGSPFDFSPRLPCSRLYSGKRIITKRTSISWRKCQKSYINASHPRRHCQLNFTMPTIISSGTLNLSPAQKVLQKFKELK